MMLSKREKLFLFLSGFFITNAIVAELAGSKLISFGPFTMTVGTIPWPIVFIATDIMNEFFGREGVKRITFLTVGLIAYTFTLVFLTMQVPAASFSPVNDQMYNAVFGQSLWIIIASIIAFAFSQLVDVIVFWFLRNKTGGKFLWLRASGSTAISQMIDSFIIIGIGFWLPGKLKTEDFLNVAASNYSFKFIIALASTPFIYLSHKLIRSYLGNEADAMIDKAAKLEEVK